jgi:hypothetical protein
MRILGPVVQPAADFPFAEGPKLLQVGIEPNRFMHDIDIPPVEQVLDVPRLKRVADIPHDREADDLRRRLEVAEDAGTAHPLEASGPRPRHKPIFL